MAAGIYSAFFRHSEQPDNIARVIESQVNPFMVVKDSASVVWQRGISFLEKRRGLISGGEWILNDSVCYIPYYNQHKKGNSVLLEKHSEGDSMRFYVQWWYSEKKQISAAKELALCMQKGIVRY